MKFAVLASGALIAALGFAAYGCSSSNPASSSGNTPDVDASTSSSSGSSGSSSSSSSSSSSGGSPDSGSTAQCGNPCQTDNDCQSWCAPVNNGVNCCDATHVCFQWSGSTCPAQTPDAGSSGNPYGP